MSVSQVSSREDNGVITITLSQEGLEDVSIPFDVGRIAKDECKFDWVVERLSSLQEQINFHTSSILNEEQIRQIVIDTITLNEIRKEKS